MSPGTNGDEIETTSPAKINLRLRILAREESGFHQLETIFCALDFADNVRVRRAASGFRLDVSGAGLGEPDNNLALRAATAFFGATGMPGGAEIQLTKRIPIGAGLGGGSSNAAATLACLNQLFGHPLEPESLLRIGAGLGSDVPFFLTGSPLALAWGRGDRLLPLRPLPAADILLAVPDFPVSTADAYRSLAAARAARLATPDAASIDPGRLRSWHGIAGLAANDFESVLFAIHPELARIKSALLQHRPCIALLSGSGSASFALFEEPGTAAAAVAALQRQIPHVRLVQTRTAVPVDRSPEFR